MANVKAAAGGMFVVTLFDMNVSMSDAGCCFPGALELLEESGPSNFRYPL